MVELECSDSVFCPSTYEVLSDKYSEILRALFTIAFALHYSSFHVRSILISWHFSPNYIR